MSKLIGPAFPPRRPSGVLRYLLAGTIVCLLYYVWNHDSSKTAELSSPVASIPQVEIPESYTIPEKPAVPVKEPEKVIVEDPDIKSQPEPEPEPEPEQEHEDGSKLEPEPEPEAQTYFEDDDPFAKRPEHALPSDDMREEDGTAKVGGAASKFDIRPADPVTNHPIDKLIEEAQQTHADLLSKETKTLKEAAEAYRKRRGRHPPPGFDRWYNFAKSHDALIVEDFFDQVYHDLEPFWGVNPSSMRKESNGFEMTIHIRDGKSNTTSDWFWTVIWQDHIEGIVHLLPDMDLALNPMDEPRMIVPYEQIQQHMKKAAKTVHLPKPEDVRSDFQKLPKPGKGELKFTSKNRKFEKTRPFWKLVQRGCAPDSLARTTPRQKTFDQPPDINMTMAEPHMYDGYVSNFTLSSELCHQPDLQGLEGILIEPLSVSTTNVMFPLFGGSKLSVNNEILLPAPMYWQEEERFIGGENRDLPWSEKRNELIWRGVATGGTNTEDNWRGFQRHRFVAMNNYTTLDRVSYEGHIPENFALPEERYEVSAQKDDQMAKWVSRWADVAFVDLMCNPPEDDMTCPHTNHYFELFDGIPMDEQFDCKVLPDIDGNSFSGRYLGFLRSTSLPIKATIFKEWHDSRLVAWKHFVPMDNRFGDYYGIMEYFFGYHVGTAHDRAAEKIATEGKEWAERVLRKEDMQIYTLRLLLEYARLLDDRRNTMGWVDDLLADQAEQ